jgi:hypothetical protein
MSRQPGRGTGHDRDDLRAAADAEVAAATSAIAALGRRLRRQSTLEHPAVSCELRKLEEQLAAQLDRAGRALGKHRLPAGRSSGQPEPGHGGDPDESGLPPKCASAATAAELVGTSGH